ncbi:MAG TPA: gas vesicle protein K [Longimicrobiales bacterium]|nr:gas vesicle protein K [Longimicrobiales bacterium]
MTSDRNPPEGGEGGERTADLREVAPALPARLDATPEDIEAGVGKLVLTLVEFIRQVLEHQAVRRMEGGSLDDDEMERLGLALMRLQERVDEIRNAFGIEKEDLNIDLGPLGRLL